MATGFATDVLPMFTDMDITHMAERGVYLNKYDYMADSTDDYANASAVYQQLSSGDMPPSWSGEQPWSAEKVQTFKDWMNGGYQP